jgi:hypothetical protein
VLRCDLVTSPAKRTQGDDGPQCESVQGMSPETEISVGADPFSVGEGKTGEANDQGFRGPTGV